MKQFFCPVCNNELDINDIDEIGINTCCSISISQFHKQCKKCNNFLYFDSQAKTFKKLSWWKRLLNNRYSPAMEVRKRTG